MNQEAPSDSTGTVDAIPIPPDGGGGQPPPPKPAPVRTMIIVDDDAKSIYESITRRTVDWSEIYSWANNILEGGDDPFWSWFSIDYVTYEYRAWNSPSGCLWDVLQWAQQAFPKPAGIDVTFVLTGQHELLCGGKAERPGDGFIVSVCAATVYLYPLVNVWQHEASHNYDAPDHNPGLTTMCIMSACWAPFTRSWCYGCTSTITVNSFRFG